MCWKGKGRRCGEYRGVEKKKLGYVGTVMLGGFKRKKLGR